MSSIAPTKDPTAAMPHTVPAHEFLVRTLPYTLPLFRATTCRLRFIRLESHLVALPQYAIQFEDVGGDGRRELASQAQLVAFPVNDLPLAGAHLERTREWCALDDVEMGQEWETRACTD